MLRSVKLGGLVIAGVLLCSCGGTATTDAAPAVQSPTAQALSAVKSATDTTLTTTSRFTMAISDSPTLGTASAAGSYDFGKSQGVMTLTPSGGSGEEQVVFSQGLIYIKGSPPNSTTQPWVSADVSELADTPPSYQQLVLQGATINPAFIINELKWGAAKASSNGTTTINGTKASRYLVSVDLKQAKAQASGNLGTVFAASISSQLKATSSLSETIYVDSSNHIVQVEFQPPGDIGKVVVKLESFGIAVTVTVPPASQVKSLSPAAASDAQQNDKSVGPEPSGGS